MAKIDNTEARVYVCRFKLNPASDSSVLARVKLVPGINEVDNSLMKGFLAHPGVKNRLDLNILKVVKKGDPILSDEDKAKLKAENEARKKAEKEAAEAAKASQ